MRPAHWRDRVVKAAYVGSKRLIGSWIGPRRSDVRFEPYFLFHRCAANDRFDDWTQGCHNIVDLALEFCLRYPTDKVQDVRRDTNERFRLC